MNTTTLANHSPAAPGRWFGFLAALAILVLPALAQAQINDNAHLFSDAARAEAEKSIQQMRDKYKHTLLIETYSSIPADKKAQYDPERKGEFVRQWAEERRRALGINGAVLLICLNPRELSFVVGNDTQRSGIFTKADEEAMRPEIAKALTDKKYDLVVTNTAASVLTRMDHNAAEIQKRGGANAPKPSANDFGWLWGLLCVGGAIIAAIFIIRGIARQRQMSGGYGYGPGPYGQGGYGPQGGGYGGGGGGGGFGRGLMGGILGGVAGSWLGNKLFGQQNYPTNYPPSTGGGEPPPPDYGGQDTSSSGGSSDFGGGDSGGGSSDFGDSGGGSDSGGGGDFGGGDSGGGSSDF